MLGLILRVVLAFVAFRFIAGLIRQIAGRPRDFDPGQPQGGGKSPGSSRFRDADIADGEYEEIRQK